MSSATALLADAETSIKAGDWDQALEQLENLKKEQPSQPEVYEKLVHVLAVRGKFQSVVTTYLELIRILMEAENLARANDMVDRVLELRPESGEARERRIEIENKRGNVARAVYLSRELARLCIDQGDGERSIRLLQDALKHEPGNLDIALELAEMFVSHGHIQDGANQYRKVANAFQAAGNIAKAAEAYRRMKVVQSDDPEVLLTLGRLYTELGRLDEAEQEFRSVLRHDLDHEQALLQLGLVCQLKGRFRSGILAFNKVLQNNPNLVSAKRKLGELHHSQGMMTEAVDFFLQAAQGHLEADEKDDAIECFQIVLSVDENNASAQQGLTNLGAPVKGKEFEPPQPPTPVEDEAPAPEPPPPPPIPFAPTAPTVAASPEPIGGNSFASERTEALPQIDFDSAAPTPEPEPVKPEAPPAAPPKKPTSSLGGGTSTGSGPGSGGGRRGLGLRQGLSGGPGGDKPMLGGEKPTLTRPGLGIRPGLGQKTMGGLSMGMAAAGDKPVLGAGGAPDRRPQLGPGRQDAPTSPPPGPGRPVSFTDTAPIEDFSEDMALSDVFAEPPGTTGPVSAMDDDFALPDSDLFDDHADRGEATLSSGFSFDDEPPAAPAPQIGAFSFESDEDSGGATSGTLRPDYAQDAPADFGEELGDDLFNFDGHPDTTREVSTPTLGHNLFEDQGGADDLFGDNGGNDLFGSNEPVGSLPISAGGGLFDDDAGASSQTDGGMFDGDSDPFENLFDDDASNAAPAATESPSDLFFDDQPGDQGDGFGDLFGDAPTEAKSIPISVGGDDDLFGGPGDDFFGTEPSSNLPPLQPEATAMSPTITREADEGLFGNDSESNDLFTDDMFADQGDERGLSPAFADSNEGSGLFDSPATDVGGSDLFSGPDHHGGFDTGSDLDAPLDGGFDLGGDDGLFGEPEAPSQGLFDAAQDDGDLFGGPQANDGLFSEPGAGDDIFGASPLVANDDFGSNGASSGGLFDGDNEPVSGGLFEALDAGSDTMFDFDAGDATAGALDTGGGGLFDASDAEEPFTDSGFASGDDLFGSPVEHDAFSEVEAGRVAPAALDELEDDGGLFGDFSSQPGEELDDIRLPLSTGSSESDDLFGGDASGSLFEPSGEDHGALSFADPTPISIPDPTPEPTQSYDAYGTQSDEGLFDGGGDLFGGGSLGLDDDPPPLELDLPMPGDAPLFSDSAEPVAEAEPELEPQRSLFDSSDSDLFSDSGFDAPLDIEIPEPSDEPLAVATDPHEDLFDSPQEPQAFSEPEPLVLAIPLGDSAEPEPLDIPEPVAVAAPAPEPVEEEDDLMGIFDSTMPHVEEDPPLDIAIPEAEPISLASPSIETELDIEIPVDFGSGEDIFEPSLETMPSFEEPELVIDEPLPSEPDPADLLSAEEKAEMAWTAQADNLEASLSAADAASRIAAYRKALEENPENLVLRTRLADIHLKYGLLEDAVVQYRQVLRRNPDSISLLHRVIQAEFWNENYTEAGDSLLALAKLHLKRGEQHEALDTLQSVLSLDPLHFEARKELVSVFTALDDSKLAAHHLRQLAETALTKGEVQGAISAFQQLLEISADPTFEERLAQIYESQGDVEKALASFQSLVGRYRAEERWEEAARVTERIVELDPNMLEDREALIALYQRLGHGQQAVEQQFQLARRYQERNELERAISLYEEVLRYQVDNHEARRYLVDAYLDAGRVSAALEQAEALTEHYLDTKNHHTAIYLYSRLVEADPENVELQERLVKFYGLAGDPENAKSRWIGISDLHERNGRYERAAEAVQKALELDESQLDLLFRLALLYAEKLGDNQAALSQLRKLFQLAPDRTDAVKMYIDLLLKEEQVSEAGQVLQRLEQAGGDGVEIKTNVIALLKASVEANPADLKARFNYGELCYHLGDLDHAIEQFQQTRRHPDFELISYNMLGLCFASKRGYMMLDLAIKQFQKGLESKGRSEQDYLEIRYNLAMVQYQNGRAKEALVELKECYNVDIAYRDVLSWIQKIEGELASGS